MTLSPCGTRIEHDEVVQHGSAIFFVSNEHRGDIRIDRSVIRNHVEGSWYPRYPQISAHDDTPIVVTDAIIESPCRRASIARRSRSLPTRAAISMLRARRASNPRAGEVASMKIAVIVFPGSNADWDALRAARDVLGAEARYVFHKEIDLGPVDAVIVPGGFAHGDYLRAGAIARFSPIADALRRFAARGGPVLGICNGFQVLTEMQLLPGALTRNAHLRFECRDVWVRCEAAGAWTGAIEMGQVLRLPIAHGEGRYVADPATLERLEGEGLVAFRYVGPDGEREPGANPNGSVSDIAGIYSEERNVLGLMPHPERAAEAIVGNTDGRFVFESLRRELERERAA